MLARLRSVWMPDTTGVAVAARLLMAATPPVLTFRLSSPWMVCTTGRRALTVALMPLTVPLISVAFWRIWLTVPSMLLAVSMICWAWPERGWAAARISSAMRPVSLSFWVSSSRETLEPGPTSVMMTFTRSSIWLAARTTRDSSMTAKRAKAMVSARLTPTMPFSPLLFRRMGSPTPADAGDQAQDAGVAQAGADGPDVRLHTGVD